MNLELQHLFDNNRKWAARMTEQDPAFFSKLANQQSPEYLWIGCADSRVPANQIVDLLPGDVFVHRNVANVVAHSDLNCLSVMQFAIDVIKVRHILVVGHYGCSGVRAALQKERHGLVDNWLRHVQDVAERHSDQLSEIPDPVGKHDRLCELNVIEQVANVCQSTSVLDAWERGQPLTVHGWVYGVKDGHTSDLGMSIRSLSELPDAYASATDRLSSPAGK